MSNYPIQAQIIRDAQTSRLVIEGPRHPTEQEAWRKAHHDYLAAMRSLRYLAQKALQTPFDTPEQAAQKKESLERHIKHLEQFEQAVVQPLLQELPRSPTDVSP
ncbi:MAG TPA: hypothetical protein VE954_08100 [Oligoflexus sp.]|uniref:hypothetical protein n=1 Tax=Oligoflexus sp. TaxID=1971216 RepID=UPI002D230FAD|nr:hypothetical protein [Oligoflexus sp.]HYX33064.1 hypothetical protein [Oligoflexus sp.]